VAAGWRGKPLAPETRKKISESLKKTFSDPEYIAKMRARLAGHNGSEKQKEKARANILAWNKSDACRRLTAERNKARVWTQGQRDKLRPYGKATSDKCWAEHREKVKHATSKVCQMCKRDLPLTTFTKASKNLDGLDSYCRECIAERHQRARDKKRAATSQNIAG
jgi:hypothetical protein